MATSLQKVVSLLNEHGVKYILIGGWAAAIHGSARSTEDVDFVYARDAENIRALAGPFRKSILTCAVLRQGSPSAGTPRPSSGV